MKTRFPKGMGFESSAFREREVRLREVRSQSREVRHEQLATRRRVVDGYKTRHYEAFPRLTSDSAAACPGLDPGI